MAISDLDLLDREFHNSTPFQDFQYVSVTFNATANADTDIVHQLNTTTPDWQVVGIEFAAAPSTVPVIYKNSAGTARASTSTYLVLRANVASLKATLLLTKRRT